MIPDVPIARPAPLYIPMGKILRPHGLKGWAKVLSFTQNPRDLFSFSLLYLLSAQETPMGKAVHLVRRGQGHGPDCFISSLGDISTPQEAKSLQGCFLAVTSQDCPALPPDTHYVFDLLGKNVRDIKGVELGRVCASHDFGAGLVLEVLCAKDDDGCAFSCHRASQGNGGKNTSAPEALDSGHPQRLASKKHLSAREKLVFIGASWIKEIGEDGIILTVEKSFVLSMA